MNWLDMLLNLDRRYIFVLIILAIVIPLILKPRFPDRPSPIVENIFEKIERLPQGAKILLAFDYGPDTAPELDPMAVSFIRHASLKNHELIIMSLWPEGAGQIQKVMDSAYLEYPDKVYGTDYVNLGYKAGGVGAINVMVSSFKTLVPQDANGTPVEDLPVMEGINKVADFDAVISLSSGDPGLKEWILFAGDMVGVPVMGGGTAVMAPELYPYYPQQLVGLMGGLKGAAEYETALMTRYPEIADRTMNATIRMGPQVVTHIVMILLIVLGNVAYFMDRRRRAGNV